MVRLYLDVCCLNRPFDDQTQDRIHLEAEAVLLIIKHIEAGEWGWLTSEVVNYEIQQTPNPERRAEVLLLATHADTETRLTEERIQRAKELETFGLKSYDALHLACAEAGNVDAFLTTDDKVIKKSQQPKVNIHIPVENPLEWLWRYIRT
jgi:predicted nucleic acid-binding protein